MTRGAAGVRTERRSTHSVVPRRAGGTGVGLRVLCVHKRSAFERGLGSVRDRASHVAKDPTLKRLVLAHQEHKGSMGLARKVLGEFSGEVVWVPVGERVRSAPWDLVLTLGGDGTLLWASHLVGDDVPVLGINTAPSDSVGHFAAGETKDLKRLLRDATAGALKYRRLHRMRVEVNGRLVSNRVLNDVLYSAKSPAGSCRYVLCLGPTMEEQRSSGLWIGPAAGSTAAQRSAGGRALPLGSKKLQFVVREPYRLGGAKYALAQGRFGPEEILEVHSLTPNATVFVDGPHKSRSVPMGAILRACASEESLMLVTGGRRDVL